MTKGLAQNNPLRFKTLCLKQVKKYAEHFGKEGWALQSKPQVRKVQYSSGEMKPVLDREGKALLYMPADTKMREDHPWYMGKEADQYEVTAWFSQPPLKAPIVFELSDHRLGRLLESGKLPPSVRLAE